MWLDDFNYALLYVLILENLWLKSASIYPFDIAELISLFSVVMVVQLVIQELLNELIQFLLRTAYIENETLVLLHIRIVTTISTIQSSLQAL